MFAAYANKGKEKNETADKTQETSSSIYPENDWLSNSSFSINSETIADIQGLPNISRKSERVENNVPINAPAKPESIELSSDSVCTPPGSPLHAGSRDRSSETDSESHNSSQESVCTPPSSPLRSKSSASRSPSVVSVSSTSSSDSTSVCSNVKDTRGNISSDAEPNTNKKSSCQRRKRDSLGQRSPSHKSQKRDQFQTRSERTSRSPHRNRSQSRSPKRRTAKGSDRKWTRNPHKKGLDEKNLRRSRSRGKSEERKGKRKHKHSKYRKGSYRKRSRSCSSSSSVESVGFKKKNKNDYRDSSNMVSHGIYEDRTWTSGYMNAPTLPKSVTAWYHRPRYCLGFSRQTLSHSKKWKAKHRYFNKILKIIEADVESSKASKESKNLQCEKVGQIQGSVNEIEEELSKVTAKFNHDLAQNPNDVDLWKKYVQFQDTVHQFERVFRRGGGASGARVTSERKLSILDKALKENPKCDELLKDRCYLAESVLPSDKCTSQLKTWIEKDPGNLVLWESLIMLSQGSLSTCRVSIIKSLYQEALTNIHSMKRGNSESLKIVESKLLDLVLHLGLFLRQSGLLELMWSLINVYLEFNLAKLDPTKFHITSTIADHALTDLEETILGSQLPLPTLWLRVETLRAGTHWVPLPADADSEDPQRLVFPEDVNDLIHPINSSHLTFRLVTITLTLLKVPILPWRDCAARAAGIHPLPWFLDGPEPLYASLLPLGSVEFNETSAVLMDASQLVCGPQYLIARPGQDEYLDFLTQVFSTCSDCLPPSQQTYLLVWWLRFYRWLMQLERLGHCKLPKGRKKKMRTVAKDLLRKECNRSNFLLFKEFALLELENGSKESTKKVLQGAISALPASKPVAISQSRGSICALYRTLVEVHLSFIHNDSQEGTVNSKVNDDDDTKAEDRKKALCLLVSLGKGTSLEDQKPSNTDIAAALSKYHHVSKEAIDKPFEEELDPFIALDVCHLAPTFVVEWTACHGWLLFLSHSIWKAAAMFENMLSTLRVVSVENSESTSTSTHENFVKVQREALMEAYVSLLRHHCYETRGSFGVLRKTLSEALKEFPGNLTLAAALADLETNSNGTGLPLWRLSKVFYELNSASAYALYVFVMRYRLKQQESAAQKAHALLNQGGPELPDPNTKNRMSTLLKKLTRHPIMRRCPLLWRLRLQFAAAVSSNDAECCSTFYLALEDCPWVKALYMDIVQVLPTQLAQVQDLLVEKELRLHITPEELEILRTD